MWEIRGRPDQKDGVGINEFIDRRDVDFVTRSSALDKPYPYFEIVARLQKGRMRRLWQDPAT